MDSDFSITKLFLTKTLTIYTDPKDTSKKFHLQLKVMKDFYEDHDWNLFYQLFILKPESLHKAFGFDENVQKTSWDYVQLILFVLGMYDKFSYLYTILRKTLESLFPEINIEGQAITVNGIIMTEEIWEYVIYLLKLSYGEKVEKPLTFSSEEARQLFLAQQAAEAKIKKMRSRQGDAEGLIKSMLAITYKFPSISIEYLFNQTMAQIHWLQKLAAGAVSYEVNAQAFAAGNVKKGKKLDFFIK